MSSTGVEKVKADAIKALRRKRKSIDSVARHLGVKESTLRGWLRETSGRIRRGDRVGRLRRANEEFWRGRDGDVNLEAVDPLSPTFVELPDAVGGDAPKSVITLDDRAGRRYERAYIAKAPRTKEGARECVTEFLITSIGKMLPISIADGRLVLFPATSSEPAGIRYMSRFFLDRDAGEELVHASRLAATCFEMKEEEFFKELPDQGQEWSFYSTSMIEGIFETGHPDTSGELLEPVLFTNPASRAQLTLLS